MSDTCLTCGGLIMEPGKVYGYAGPVCYCLKEQRVCRPASFERTNYNGHYILNDEDFERLLFDLNSDQEPSEVIKKVRQRLLELRK